MQTRMPWPEFWWHLSGLLGDTTTRLHCHFAPKQRPDDAKEVTDER